MVHNMSVAIVCGSVHMISGSPYVLHVLHSHFLQLSQSIGPWPPAHLRAIVPLNHRSGSAATTSRHILHTDRSRESTVGLSFAQASKIMRSMFGS